MSVEEGYDIRATFAAVDGQVDRGLSTCCVEVSSPKHDILAAERAYQSHSSFNQISAYNP